MTRDDFIRALSALLSNREVPEPLYEAARFVIDNPGMETEWTPQAAADEWLNAAGGAVDWKDPARYGAS